MCTIFRYVFPIKRRITRKIHVTKPYHLGAIHKPFSQSQIIKLIVTILVYLNIDTVLVCVKQKEKQIWTPEQFPISTFHSIHPTTMFCMSRLYAIWKLTDSYVDMPIMLIRFMQCVVAVFEYRAYKMWAEYAV